MRKLMRMFSGRRMFSLLLILIQFVLLNTFFYLCACRFVYFRVIMRCLCILSVFCVVSDSLEASMKLLLCSVLFLFSDVSGFWYFVLKKKKKKKKSSKRKIDKESQILLDLLQEKTVFKSVLMQSESYLRSNTKTKYFSDGEYFKQELLNALRKAEKVIFIEFFIVSEGQFWAQVLQILEEKRRQGVEVYLMIDEMGCLLTMRDSQIKRLKQLGIGVAVFHPLTWKLSLDLLVRDHRKMVVVDHKVAFMGGCNLSDEYVNQRTRYGYWKDTAVMLEGEGALCCAFLFQSFYNAHSQNKISNDLIQSPHSVQSKGFVLPFVCDCENESESALMLHLKLISSAKRTLDIQTPYLILNQRMLSALKLASKSGVCVRIFVPCVPDRWFVHQMSQDCYYDLIEAGVHVYEYLPGFIHSKVMLVDNETALCGSINLDDRSYFFQHECGVLMKDCEAVLEIKEDFDLIFKQSREIHCKECSIYVRIFRFLIRIFKPML